VVKALLLALGLSVFATFADASEINLICPMDNGKQQMEVHLMIDGDKAVMTNPDFKKVEKMDVTKTSEGYILKQIRYTSVQTLTLNREDLSYVFINEIVPVEEMKNGKNLRTAKLYKTHDIKGVCTLKKTKNKI
jgi:hypothetical protein